MTGVHRRSTSVRRWVAAGVILAAGATGTVLGLRDDAPVPDRPVASDSFPATLGPPFIAEPSVPPGSTPTWSVRPAASVLRSVGASPLTALLSPSVSAPVSTSPVPVTSAMVRSSTSVKAPVSMPVSTSVSVPVSGSSAPASPTDPVSASASGSASCPPQPSVSWPVVPWPTWLLDYARHRC